MKKQAWIVLTAVLMVWAVLFAACAPKSAVPEGTPEGSAPGMTTAPTPVPTPTPTPAPTHTPTPTPEAVDPFRVEDDVVDSTEDVVLDFYEFLAQCNAAHKAVTQMNYSKAFYNPFTPDFHDTLNLVSEEEANALLNSKRSAPGTVCTKEEALQDVDLLFRLYRSFFGGYAYFGGEEAFDAAEHKIIAKINAYSGTLTVDALSELILGELDFITDRHMNVGEYLLCEYHGMNVTDYYVKDLYFYEDDAGFYTRINGRKWHLQQVGADSAVAGYLKVTVDGEGRLCYMLLLSVRPDDTRLDSRTIQLSRGERMAEKAIVWTDFSQRPLASVSETLEFTDGIPVLKVDLRENGAEVEEAQQERLRQMGPDLLEQDVLILDANSGCGWQSLFDSVDHSSPEVFLYKLSKTAEYLGRRNMPWARGTYGEYVVNQFEGQWGENGTLVFAVQDKTNYSASEDTISDIRAMENVITLGGSTGGTAGPGSSTGQAMVLPNTGLYVHFGASLSMGAGYTEEGYCIDPDIWVEPTKAADAARRLCKFYGIENRADTSVLAPYGD